MNRTKDPAARAYHPKLQPSTDWTSRRETERLVVALLSEAGHREGWDVEIHDEAGTDHDRGAPANFSEQLRMEAAIRDALQVAGDDEAKATERLVARGTFRGVDAPMRRTLEGG